MNYRRLGNSKLEISEISFGCMSLEGNYSYVEKLIHEAIDHGVTYFDTADLYQKGRNEEIIGKALKVQRTKILIGTKVGNQWRVDGSGWDWNPSKNYILKAVDKSLQRLQTDYIDLYQLHGGTIQDPIDEIIEAFEILKEQGKIRYYGISSIRPNVIREWVKRSNLVSVMMQYSILDRRPEEECLGLLQTNNIGVLARGVLAKGLLADKEAREYLSFHTEKVKHLQQEIKAIVGTDGDSYDAAINFVLQNNTISSAVLGIRKNIHMYDIKRFLGKQRFDPNIVSKLLDLLPAEKYQKHR